MKKLSKSDAQLTTKEQDTQKVNQNLKIKIEGDSLLSIEEQLYVKGGHAGSKGANNRYADFR